MLLTLDTITVAHHAYSAYGPFGPYLDANGTEWVLNSEKGWFGGPAPRTKRTDRLTGDGAFRAVSYRGVRIITLEGVTTALDDLTMRKAQQQVLGVCSDGTRLYPLTVQDETGTYTAQVELDAEILSQPLAAGQFFWSLQVAAPDPRKYLTSWSAPTTNYGTPGVGGMVTSGGLSAGGSGISTGTAGIPGTLAVVNPGTAPVGPVLRIDGPITNPTVSDVTTGVTVVFTGTVDAGHSLWINCDDQPQTPPGLSVPLPGHSVLLDGAYSRRSQVALYGGWLALPAGSSARYLFSGSSAGSPLLTAYYRPAWR